MSSPESLPAKSVEEAVVQTEPDASKQEKEVPPYVVILHNDDINGFDYVLNVLQKVLGYGWLQAFKLTMEAHKRGSSVVWSGSKEVAELRADQLRSCGPDPLKIAKGALPLQVSIKSS